MTTTDPFSVIPPRIAIELKAKGLRRPRDRELAGRFSDAYADSYLEHVREGCLTIGESMKKLARSFADATAAFTIQTALLTELQRLRRNALEARQANLSKQAARRRRNRRRKNRG